MATTQVSAVANNSIDVANLSVATSLPSGSDPRSGSIYNAASLAGVQPLWFHPLKDGRWLMLTSRSWSEATPVGGNPGIYSSYTETAQPSWFFVNGSTGQLTFTPNGSIIPFRTTVSSSTLVGAASRSTDMLWPLHSVTIGGQRQAVLQHFAISSSLAITNAGEEVVPSTEEVVFDKGVQYATPYLVIWGTDAEGKLYCARKSWASVGFNASLATNTKGQPTAQGRYWEFHTGTGWSQDIAELAPFQDGLTSDGPVSFGYWQTVVLLSTVIKTGTNYTGAIWQSNKGRPYVPQTLPTPLSLGSTSDDTYCGGGVQMLSQVGANSSALPVGTNAGIVYVSTKKVFTSGHTSLSNIWGAWPISLVG
jgi:hypothetical protein